MKQFQAVVSHNAMFCPLVDDDFLLIRSWFERWHSWRNATKKNSSGLPWVDRSVTNIERNDVIYPIPATWEALIHSFKILLWFVATIRKHIVRHRRIVRIVYKGLEIPFFHKDIQRFIRLRWNISQCCNFHISAIVDLVTDSAEINFISFLLKKFLSFSLKRNEKWSLRWLLTWLNLIFIHS